MKYRIKNITIIGGSYNAGVPICERCKYEEDMFSAKCKIYPETWRSINLNSQLRNLLQSIANDPAAHRDVKLDALEKIKELK